MHRHCLSLDRGVYARLCVEVDLTSPLALGANVEEDDDPDPEISFFDLLSMKGFSGCVLDVGK